MEKKEKQKNFSEGISKQYILASSLNCHIDGRFHNISDYIFISNKNFEKKKKTLNQVDLQKSLKIIALSTSA